MNIVFTKTITSFLLFVSIFCEASPYTLEEAIAKAQALDPWIDGSVHRQQSLDALSQETASLPDPLVNIGLANLPVDTFDFSQEPMTQFKLGVSQMFPRGATLALNKERYKKLSQMQPHARDDRRAKVVVTVSHLWLEVYRNELTIYLIEKDRGLFEHLVDVSQSKYTSTSGRARQQDIVRSQLELTRLDDRLTRLRLQRDEHIAKLGEWLHDEMISIVLPENKEILVDFKSADRLGEANNELGNYLTMHPAILSINSKISASKTSVELAKQSYKPQWGINASYGYRESTPDGDERSDFFSAGVSFDVPLFAKNRQDKKVKSAHHEYEAMKTERALALRKLQSAYFSTLAVYRRLVERKSLFNSRLLKETTEQAEAALSAYTSDDGDFAEVVRARIAELNARIEALDVDIDLQKNISQLNYFFIGSDEISTFGLEN